MSKIKKVISSNIEKVLAIALISMSLVISHIVEVISCYITVLHIETSHFNNLAIAVFSALIVLGLFSGTIIAIASKSVSNKFGMKGNYIAFYDYSFFGINLTTLIYISFSNMVISAILLILGKHNALFAMLFLTFVIIFLQLYLAIELIGDRVQLKKIYQNHLKIKLVKSIRSKEDEFFALYIRDYVKVILEEGDDNIYDIVLEKCYNDLEDSSEKQKFFMRIDKEIYYQICDKNYKYESKRKVYDELILKFKIKDTNKKMPCISITSIKKLSREIEANFLDMYYLLLEIYDHFDFDNDHREMYRRELTSNHFTLYRNALILNKVSELDGLEKVFVSLFDSYANIEEDNKVKLMLNIFKLLIDEGNVRFIYILRKIVMQPWLNRSSCGVNFVFDLACYIYYYANHPSILPSEKERVIKLLSEKPYNELSFLDIIQKHDIANLDMGTELIELELTKNRINYIAYRCELNEFECFKFKLYIAILKEFKGIELDSVKKSVLNVNLQHFENNVLTQSCRNELSLIAEFYQLRLQQTSKFYEREIYDRMSQKYWELEKIETKEQYDKFEKNILSKIKDSFHIKQEDEISTDIILHITNYEKLERFKEQLTMKINTDKIIEIKELTDCDLQDSSLTKYDAINKGFVIHDRIFMKTAKTEYLSYLKCKYIKVTYVEE